MFLHFEMEHTENILLFINLKVVNHLFILLTESLTENKVYTHTNIYIFWRWSRLVCNHLIIIFDYGAVR